VKLKIALSKGELYKNTLALLEGIGLSVDALRDDTRKLSFKVENDDVEYFICRPTDVPVYIQYGVADIGVVGKDVLMEQGKDVYELVDLGFGGCRFVVAEPEDPLSTGDVIDRRHGHLLIATKYPRVTEDYFSTKGVQVEVIKLHGNVELAPLVGLSHQIVDLASSGRTLRENGLRIVDTIEECTARLIANPVSMKTKHEHISALVTRIQGALG